MGKEIDREEIIERLIEHLDELVDEESDLEREIADELANRLSGYIDTADLDDLEELAEFLGEDPRDIKEHVARDYLDSLDDKELRELLARIIVEKS